MKNKVEKKREVKKLELKSVKISKATQAELTGGGWEDYWSYVFCH